MNRSNRSVVQLLKREGFRSFLSLCLKYKKYYLIVAILQLAGTVTSLMMAEVSRRIFDGGTNLPRGEMNQLLAGLVVFVFLGLLLSLLTRVFNQIVNTNVVFQMRQIVLSRLMNVSLSYHENRHSSEAKNLIFGELEVFKQFVVFDVLRLITLPFAFVSVGIYLFTIQPMLGVIAICVGPLQLISNLVINKSFKELVAKQQKWGGEVFFHMGETLAGIREVKMNQLEKSVFQKFHQICQEGIRLWVAIEKMQAYRELVRALPERLGYLIGMVIGTLLLVNGHIQAGSLVAFITLLNKAAEPFTSIVGIINSLQKVSAGAEKLLDFMEMKTEQMTGGSVLSNDPPRIEFENVSFAYEEGREVLRNVSFSLEPGHTLALVGPSGGGKSTIIKLLYRFYAPQEGTIRINGIPIEQYSIDSLRSSLATVTQDVFLFDGSIRDNIVIGASAADEQAVYRAAVLSQSYEFIRNLPEHFETMVGERGIKLSQGQKQRIAIARAVLRNAPVLVLDEPTSSLDVENESLFQNSLNEWAGSSSKLIIAHRLSTIRKADTIVFLEKGEVREMGSPKELLHTGGRFFDFWEKQEIKEFVS